MFALQSVRQLVTSIYPNVGIYPNGGIYPDVGIYQHEYKCQAATFALCPVCPYNNIAVNICFVSLTTTYILLFLVLSMKRIIIYFQVFTSEPVAMSRAVLRCVCVTVGKTLVTC